MPKILFSSNLQFYTCYQHYSTVYIVAKAVHYHWSRISNSVNFMNSYHIYFNTSHVVELFIFSLRLPGSCSHRGEQEHEILTSLVTSTLPQKELFRRQPWFLL